MVRKTETAVRSELAQNTTCALLSVDMITDERHAHHVPGVEVLQAARCAAAT